VVDTRHPIVYLRGSEFQPGQVGTITSQDMRDLLVSLDTGFLLAANYGVVANGVQTASAAPTGTDDTAAWAAVFAAASTGSPVAVLAPPGISMVTGNLTIPPGVALIGQPNTDYPYNDGGPFVNGGGSALWKTTGTAPLVTMNGANLTNNAGGAGLAGSSISYMALYGWGSGGGQGIVQQATRFGIAYIHRCTVANFSVGIDGSVSYASGYMWAVVDGCAIMGNGTGLQDFVDSRIINNFIAANTGIGFGSSGGADTLVMGNKIETNGTHGVAINAGDNMQVTNNNFDAQGYNAVQWTGTGGGANSSNGLLSGNTMRRSGSYATANSGNDAHIYLSGNWNVVVTNNVTRSMQRENTPVIYVPNSAIAGGANTSGLIANNSLQGYAAGGAAFQTANPVSGMTIGTNLT
jgi:hypothetical protein